MQIRPLHPEEYYQARRMSDIAFVRPHDEDALRAREVTQEQVQHYIGAFDDRGRLIAALHGDPYTVMFDGNAVGMCGIGGVISLPESRQQGNVRALHATAMERMLERGDIFSVLYPFSNVYYRQFGFEAMSFPCATLPLRCLESFPSPARVDMLGDGTTRDELSRLQSSFIRAHNLGMLRSEDQWNKILRGGLRDRVYTYLMRDGDGAPNAHVVLNAHGNANHRLHLSDVSYRDGDALRGVLGFLYRLRAQCADIVLELPTGVNPFYLFPEPCDVTITLAAIGMVRVIDVPAALAGMRHPKIEGAYTIAVRDAFLPRNEGTYRVTYGGGETTVHRVVEEPDIALSVEALGLLVLGCCTPDEIAARGDLQMNRNADTLRRVFVRKSLYTPDRF